LTLMDCTLYTLYKEVSSRHALQTNEARLGMAQLLHWHWLL